MTPYRGIPHRAAGGPPVREGDVVVSCGGAVFPAETDAVLVRGCWMFLASNGGWVWLGRSIVHGDRVIPAQRPGPRGGWGWVQR